jgi:hypothetical protein
MNKKRYNQRNNGGNAADAALSFLFFAFGPALVGASLAIPSMPRAAWGWWARSAFPLGDHGRLRIIVQKSVI